MRFLVLGGTAWLGHRIAATAIGRGHDVTCVARGSAVPEGARLVAADRDRDDALEPVLGERWDAVFDVARQPGHARRAVRDLEPVADRYVLVSSASVYASHAELGADETAERLPSLVADRMADMAEYGNAKAACEDAVLAAFGPERAAIARAGLIGGPGDPSGRTDHWPWRFAHPAVPDAVLVPDAPDLPTAVIDVRDLAAWLIGAAARGVRGVFNVQGEPLPLPDHLAAAREAAASSAFPLAAPVPWLVERGVNEWSGPRSMPLWLADRSWYGMNARSTTRAEAAGLVRRPLLETLRDALAWRREHPDAPRAEAGLDDAEERELIAALRDARKPV